jgi:RNA polymerase sigma factor (sigma-70 family)
MSSSPAQDHSADIYWWERLAEDHPEALAYFYDRYADWLLRYGLSVVYDREVVQDAVQELFLQIWNSRRNLSTPGSVKFYFMASIRRIILKTVRSERTLCDQVEEAEDISTTDSTEEIHEAVQHAVRCLPPRQQEVIFLKYYEKLSYDQISQLTGLDYQILRNTIHRAVKALRVLLTNQADVLFAFLFLLF